MNINFLDKKSGELAVLSQDCTEFVINAEGHIYEVCEQTYANFFALLRRDDVMAIINSENSEDIKILCINCGPQKVNSLRCGICDAVLD